MNKSMLYIMNFKLRDDSGVDKKVVSQINVLKKLGMSIDIFEMENIGDEFITFFNGSILNRNKEIFKERKFDFYRIKKVLEKLILNYDYIYIRYSGNPFFYYLLSYFYSKKIKVIIEIPTYPYEGEILNNKVGIMKFKFIRKVRLYLDRFLTNTFLKKYVYKIVLISENKERKLFGIDCINIENGIEVEKIKKIEKREKEEMGIISVSGMYYWHGIDRFLYSLLQYKKNGGKEKIKFHIVGEGTETPKLKKIVEDNIELQDIVIFHGFKSGEDLDEVYNNSDIAIGSLGFFRSGLEKGSTLKMREYCAKGLPFVVGYDDTSFSKDLPFYYQVSNDESLLDIEKIIEWYKNLKVIPEEIRKYAEDNLTWDKQMKKVIDSI